jgi:hypothetical protein
MGKHLDYTNIAEIWEKTAEIWEKNAEIWEQNSNITSVLT